MAETSSKYFIQILDVLSEFGLSQKACLDVIGLSELPRSNRVNADLLTRILNFAASQLNDFQIGMKCGLKYPILQYNRPAEFLKLCRDIEQAADIYSKYCPLFHTVGTPSGVISEDGIDRMVWTPSPAYVATEDSLQFIELIMTNFITSINWLAWKAPQAVRQVNFCHAAILPVEHYSGFLDCDIKFSQAEYSLILDENVKTAPFATSDQVELAKVIAKFDMALNELLAEYNFADRIELYVRNAIGDSVPNKAATAKALGLSERSMARRLENNGTCFKDIKNRVLKNIAITKIEQGLPLAEIAYSLGYNDQPSFTRAFKKWYGYTPKQHITSAANSTSKSGKLPERL